MSYRDLQERLSNLLARRTLNGQTPGGTPPTVPDGRRRQDAPGETLVGGSDKLVDTAAPTHVQTMIDAVAVMDEQRDRLAAVRQTLADMDAALAESGLPSLYGDWPEAKALVAIREIIYR